MRIAMVLDSWDNEANGAVVSTRRFTEWQRAAGHEITIVANAAPEPGVVPLPTFEVPFFGGIMRRMKFQFARPDRGILAGVLARHDLIHIQFPFWLGVRAMRMARRAGVPTVATFHVQGEHILYNVGVRSDALIALVYRLFLRTVYDHADCVVCPSGFTERELRRYGLRAPSVVISNGVPSIFRPAPPGTGPRRDELERLGAMLTNPPIFDFVSTEDLIPYYSAAVLCVHASEVEVEGMAALEALACGAPCLIADAPRSATPQFALDERYRFASGSPDALVAKLDALLDDPVRLGADRERALELARSYRFELSAEKLVALYGEVLQARGIRPVVRQEFH